MTSLRSASSPLSPALSTAPPSTLPSLISVPSSLHFSPPCQISLIMPWKKARKLIKDDPRYKNYGDTDHVRLHLAARKHTTHTHQKGLVYYMYMYMCCTVSDVMGVSDVVGMHTCHMYMYGVAMQRSSPCSDERLSMISTSETRWWPPRTSSVAY